MSVSFTIYDHTDYSKLKYTDIVRYIPMFKIKINNEHIFQANYLAPHQTSKFCVKNGINISDDCGVLKMMDAFEIVYLGKKDNLTDYNGNSQFPLDKTVTRNRFDKINSKFSEEEMNKMTNLVLPKDCLKELFDQLKRDYSK